MSQLHPDVLANIAKAQALPPVSSEPVTDSFTAFVVDRKDALATGLAQLKSETPRISAFSLSASLVPPGAAIVDESIKGYCGIPYRTPNGMTPECPGLTRNLHGCPPHAPPVDETKALLQRGTALVLLQFEGREGAAPQGEVHHFMLKVSKALMAQGYDVLETYASGPCRVCPKGCGDTADCRLPARRLFAFEACGFWVNTLVEAGAPYPLWDPSPKPVEWLIDWRLPTQNTDAIRYNAGVLLA